jgi:hypothetical protein
VAVVAFDAVLADLPLAEGSNAVVLTRHGRLTVRPVTRPTARRGYVALRQAHGSLRVGRHPAVGIIVEVLPWSARMSEIMLSSTVHGFRSAWPLTVRTYLRAAHEAVAGLSQAVEQWPVGFLGGLADTPDDGAYMTASGKGGRHPEQVG